MVRTILALEREPRLAHGFSTLALGSMRRGPDDPSPGTSARRAFAQELGLEPDQITVAGSVHGAAVARVDEATAAVEGVDALVTDRAGIPLLATFADCYPILLWDRERPALALVHAGWRGTEAGVAQAAVRALVREYGSDPGRLLAGIGPGICGDCYEVGEEVADRFEPEIVRPSPGGRYLLDLAAANVRALLAAGLCRDRIHVLGLCTMESADLPSHRRSPDGNRFACLAAIR